MNTLLLEFWTEEDDFCMYAEGEDYEKELRLEGQAGKIVKRFETVYKILEKLQEEREDDLQEALQALSEQLLAPFAAPLRMCSQVRFVVYEDLVRCAFDLLPFEGQPLFLQRRVCYQVEEGQGEDEPSIQLDSALLVADLTADPEEACKAVAKLIPHSQYVEIEEADVEMIRKAADQVDALVVSAHGELDDDNHGGVEINDQTISPKLIAKLEAWIVYFDSCQQGVNMDYLQAFQEESDAQFYLAPVTSNDAGDSSTRTMTWFFTAVMKHGDPIQALFETRQRLFEYYRQKKRLNLVVSLNKAFVFRIYEFVGS